MSRKTATARAQTSFASLLQRFSQANRMPGKIA